MYPRRVSSIIPARCSGADGYTRMSADELEETFVVSCPQEEQMFKRRDRFDMIVFYDQSTQSNAFLQAFPANDQERTLRRLYDALWEFSWNKRLQRPPYMLAGGLDAWIDLMGSSSLKTSDEPLRNITRSVNSTPNSSVVARTHWRPVLEQKVPPINIEEEQKWLEQLQRESDPLTFTVPTSPSTGDDSKTRRRGTSIVANNPSIQFPRTVEEFVSNGNNFMIISMLTDAGRSSKDTPRVLIVAKACPTFPHRL